MGQYAGLLLTQKLASRPFDARWRYAQFIGRKLLYADPEYRNIVNANLGLAFPALLTAQREALVQRNAVEAAFASIDRLRAWRLGEDELRESVELVDDGLLRVYRGKPLVLICPHFLGLDMAAQRLSLEGQFTTIYRAGRDGPFERLRRAARSRFNAQYLAPTGSTLHPLVRRLRRGVPMFLLPDYDTEGAAAQVFAPFFGEPAATSPLAAWLARRHRATLLPVSVQRLQGDRHRIMLHPPLPELSADTVEATAQINRVIEKLIMSNPAQYWWANARYKTRPDGARPIYSERALRAE